MYKETVLLILMGTFFLDGVRGTLVITNGPQDTNACLKSKANIRCGFTGGDPNLITIRWNIIKRNSDGIIQSNETLNGYDLLVATNGYQWVPDSKNGNNSKLVVGPVNGTFNQSSYQCLIQLPSSYIPSNIGVLTVIGTPDVPVVTETKIGTNHAYILWEHLDNSVCGNVTYHLQLRLLPDGSDKSIILTPCPSYKFSDLGSNVVYRLSIWGSNNAGVGKAVSFTFKTQYLKIINAPRSIDLCSDSTGNIHCGFEGANPNEVEVLWYINRYGDKSVVNGNDILSPTNGLQWILDTSSGNNNSPNSKLIVGPVSKDDDQSTYQCSLGLPGDTKVNSTISTLTVNGPPEAPDIMIGVNGIKQLQIIWNSIEDLGCGSVTYHVKLVTLSGQLIKQDTTMNTNYHFTGLTPNTYYSASLFGHNDAGDGDLAHIKVKTNSENSAKSSKLRLILGLTGGGVGIIGIVTGIIISVIWCLHRYGLLAKYCGCLKKSPPQPSPAIVNNVTNNQYPKKCGANKGDRETEKLLKQNNSD